MSFVAGADAKSIAGPADGYRADAADSSKHEIPAS